MEWVPETSCLPAEAPDENQKLRHAGDRDLPRDGSLTGWDAACLLLAARAHADVALFTHQSLSSLLSDS